MPLKPSRPQRERKRLVRIDLSPQWTFFQSLSSIPWRTIAEALRRIQAAFDSLFIEEPIPPALRPRRLIAMFFITGDFTEGTDVTNRIELALRLQPGETARPVQAFLNATTVPSGGDLILDVYYSTDPFDTDPNDREWFPIFPELTQDEIDEGVLDVNAHKLILPEGQERREVPVVKFVDDPAPLDLPYSTLLRCDVLLASDASVGLAQVVFEVTPASEIDAAIQPAAN